MQAKNANLPGWLTEICEPKQLNSLADWRFSWPTGPAGRPAGIERMAKRIPSLSIASKLTSGVQGRFSAGVCQPTFMLSAALPIDGGKIWWWMSTREGLGSS